VEVAPAASSTTQLWSSLLTADATSPQPARPKSWGSGAHGSGEAKRKPDLGACRPYPLLTVKSWGAHLEILAPRGTPFGFSASIHALLKPLPAMHPEDVVAICKPGLDLAHALR
jgi:hypothetical protein